MIYKADGGEITIASEKLDTDVQPMIEKLVHGTARGTNKRTGNKRFDETFTYFDNDILSDLETDEGNLNNLEIYMFGNTTNTPDHTVPNVDVIASERMVFDPEAEDEGGLELNVKRVWNG